MPSEAPAPLGRRLVAEGIGSFFLFAGVIGSGVMAEALSGGNVAVALLANTIATGAILYVLITAFGPVSGAHFNPAVSMIFALRREIGWRTALAFTIAQIAGGITGTLLAHAMFEQPLLHAQRDCMAGEAGEWWPIEQIEAAGLPTLFSKAAKAIREEIA